MLKYENAKNPRKKIQSECLSVFAAKTVRTIEMKLKQNSFKTVCNCFDSVLFQFYFNCADSLMRRPKMRLFSNLQVYSKDVRVYRNNYAHRSTFANVITN